MAMNKQNNQRMVVVELIAHVMTESAGLLSSCLNEPWG